MNTTTEYVWESALAGLAVPGCVALACVVWGVTP